MICRLRVSVPRPCSRPSVLFEMRDDYVSRNRYVRHYTDRLLRSMK